MFVREVPEEQNYEDVPKISILGPPYKLMQLYKHQQDILNNDPKKCGLFLGTGSGKTMTALALAKGNTLVIAPKTTRDDKTWERNLQALMLDDRIIDGKRYINTEESSVILTVVSKEDFRRDWELLSRYDTVIIDEAHTVCGISPVFKWVNKKPVPKTSQLFDACLNYVQQTNPERLYLLTATPIRNPMSVYALGLLLGRDWDFYAFRNIYYVPVRINNREIWMPKKDSQTQERLGKCVRGLGYTGQLSDWFDIPDQNYITKYIPLSVEQTKKLKELPLDWPDPLVLCGKRNQVENGILSGDEYSEPQFFDNGKVEAILDLSLEFPKMIVFAKYILQIQKIKEALEKEGKKVFILTGETKNREEIINEANKSTEYVLIVSSQISAGWELPECPCMVFASMSYSIVDRIQSEGRILRANHLKKNLYVTLIAKGNTVDEAVYKCIDNKKDFSEAIYSKVI